MDDRLKHKPFIKAESALGRAIAKSKAEGKAIVHHDYYGESKKSEIRASSAVGRALENIRNKAAKKDGYSGVVKHTPEFSRIMNIPIRHLDLDDVLDLTSIFRKPGGTMDLRAIQSAALLEANKANGLFGPIAVGAGKTILTLLMPEAMDSKRTVLLVPPQLRDQLAREIEEVYGPHFNLPLDRIVRILAYSELSLAKNAELLDELDPDLIVADECHNLQRKESTRTKRFRRFMRESPHCRLVALSGTMTRRSIKDYAHIIELCLRKSSPLPVDHKELNVWASAIDVLTNNAKKAEPGALKQFLLPEDKGNIRLAYRRRLVTVEGVIASQEGAIGTGLQVIDIKPDKMNGEVVNALEEVKANWEYEGEVFASPIAYWRFCRQMSSGFYYRWVWPKGAPDQDDLDWLEARAAWKKQVREKLKNARSGADSELLLNNAAERWRKKAENHSKCKGSLLGEDHSRCNYQAERRPTEDECSCGEEDFADCDCQPIKYNDCLHETPDECTGKEQIFITEECLIYSKHPQYCTGVKTVRPKPGSRLFPCEEYITWKKVKGRYNPSPPTEAVVISNFICVDAIARAKALKAKGHTVIIWYMDRIIGTMLEELSGFPHFGAGTDSSTSTDDIIICSVATQSVGKNLQHFNRAIIITMPTGGKAMEQLLGREHRPGQMSDLVIYYYYAHTESLDKCMNDVIADAMYIQDTNGGQQKILYADGAAISAKKISQRKLQAISTKIEAA